MTTRPFSALTRKDRLLTRVTRAVAALHTAVFRYSGGRLGRRWFRGEILLLTVRGRRSGRAFTVPVMFIRAGDDLVVAASNGGIDREPQWWLNLRAQPHGEVEIRGRRMAVTASEVHGAERATLWARLGAAYGGYEGYQAGVEREIAVVRLRQVDLEQ